MERPEICFLLALIGGIISAAGALMMGVMMMGIFGLTLGASGVGFMAMLVGWLVLFQLVGGIAMIVAAPRLRREADARSGSMWALVGGILAAVGGNLLAGALGIVAGVLLRTDASAAGVPARG